MIMDYTRFSSFECSPYIYMILIIIIVTNRFVLRSARLSVIYAYY